MTRWHLEGYFDNNLTLRKVPIEHFPFGIGRSHDIDLTIHQKDVSRHHAEIVERDNQLYLRDLGSTNGTFVNNVKIVDETHIQGNDVIHFAHIESRLTDQGTFLGDGSETLLMLGGLSDRIPVGANNLMAMIENALINVVFQAVIDASDQIVGYEILGRGNHPMLPKAPSKLFHIAESIDQAIELSELFRTVGLKQFAACKSDKFILVNMHPRELEDPQRLIAGLDRARQELDGLRIILELHEQSVTNLSSVQMLAQELAKMQIGIAYDDFGAGQARLVELSSAPPEIVKFDIELIKDIDLASLQRQEMLRILVAMVHHMGVKALAEGVSREGEAAIVKDLGFDLLQGFYYGHPLTEQELKEFVCSTRTPSKESS